MLVQEVKLVDIRFMTNVMGRPLGNHQPYSKRRISMHILCVCVCVCVCVCNGGGCYCAFCDENVKFGSNAP